MWDIMFDWLLFHVFLRLPCRLPHCHGCAEVTVNRNQVVWCLGAGTVSTPVSCVYLQYKSRKGCTCIWTLQRFLITDECTFVWTIELTAYEECAVSLLSVWVLIWIIWTAKTNEVLPNNLAQCRFKWALSSQRLSRKQPVRRCLLLGRPFSTWQHQREAELSVVLVSGLVVLLLYNKPGRPTDHSLREAVNTGPLWLHSCIQSSHQPRFAFNLNQRKNPPPTLVGFFFPLFSLFLSSFGPPFLSSLDSVL